MRLIEVDKSWSQRIFLPLPYRTVPVRFPRLPRVFDTSELIALKRSCVSQGIMLRNTQPRELSEKLDRPFCSTVSPLGPEVLYKIKKKKSTILRNIHLSRLF